MKIYIYLPHFICVLKRQVKKWSDIVRQSMALNFINCYLAVFYNSAATFNNDAAVFINGKSIIIAMRL